ncbi:HAD family hydrolase [Streptomyces clavuligerus]|nr:HAD family hydrolase [Streptomyces clavuligerus]AXU16161.1 HAD family hydrolase [Streptomyces clavuligerus]MBY6306309.1 HAD family hydrolase [Streptomyces clavuligerus]QCS08940.1 hydrolase [Streptomyces clavuligerus]QPJ91723.1 HAD family hydrolase [Streptomyces clavuligerus]QPL66147.1 HAD family hydrolase [Streptomyces clavuligerus]
MPALVVFDCYKTLITAPPVPGPEEFTTHLSAALAVDAHLARKVVDSVYGAVFTAMTDPAALQPATLALLDEALREQGEPRPRAALEEALWQAFGCADPAGFALCGPVADAMRRVAAAGHTVRLLSNCYLPGSLMRRLLRRTGVPDVYERALFSGDGGPKKPDPRAFRLIGEGAFDRRAMVGDDEEIDIAPAAALGWDTVRVDTDALDPVGLPALARR